MSQAQLQAYEVQCPEHRLRNNRVFLLTGEAIIANELLAKTKVSADQAASGKFVLSGCNFLAASTSNSWATP